MQDSHYARHPPYDFDVYVIFMMFTWYLSLCHMTKSYIVWILHFKYWIRSDSEQLPKDKTNNWTVSNFERLFAGFATLAKIDGEWVKAFTRCVKLHLEDAITRSAECGNAEDEINFTRFPDFHMFCSACFDLLILHGAQFPRKSGTI